MLISLKHRLVVLAMPKCASTALENALAGQMDMVLRGAPGIKHTTFRKYERFLQPYLASYTKESFEVVSLIREPVDWLHSWWRYRGRDGVPDPANSTRNMPFEEFVRAYLDGQRKPADVGRQARFVARADGSLGVDRLFRYDRLSGFQAFLERRLETAIRLEHVNVSPKRAGAPALPGPLAAELETALAEEFRLYREIAA